MDAQVEQGREVGQGLAKTRETWFRRLTRLFSQPSIEPALWEELEEALLGADVGLALTEVLLARTRERVRREGLSHPDQVRTALKAEMVALLARDGGNATPALADAPAPPAIVLVVGVNGGGKTTTIAKLAHRELQKGRRVLLVAGDTFRAAAMDQLRVWGDRLGVEVISHQPGADPAAVVFDGIQAGRRRQAQAVIVDTAGRLHTKSNLMEELRKVRRVADKARSNEGSVHVLLVLDATTGQNGLAQAREFVKAVGVDAVVLTKLDGTAKGGIVLAISRELGVPIAYVGTGEGLADLAEFDPIAFADALIG